MVGSILLVLTFSKSADDYFGNIWEFFGNSLEILSRFFGDVWLGGSECVGVDFG